MIRRHCLLLTFLSALPLTAQKVEEDRVREVLSFLASDELAGRDSPSPGLEKAANFLAKGFEAAGLQPAGGEGGYFFRYSLPGVRLDASEVELTLIVDGKRTRLMPDTDFRIWSSSRCPYALCSPRLF